MEIDALRNKPIETGGGGLFLKIGKGESVKVRVLTTDPVVSKDQYGNGRFAFVVWNFTEDKAQVINKGFGFARQFQQLHLDEDYGADIRKIDLKITASSTGPEIKDVEYAINPLPKAETLTNEQITEAARINLDEVIKDGTRYSEWTAGDKEEVEEREDDSAKDETVLDDDQPINLDDIPF